MSNLHHYVEVDGEPSCQSDATLSDAFRDKPTRCAWATREAAQAEADRIARLTGLSCRAVIGYCPRGGEEDDPYRDDR